MHRATFNTGQVGPRLLSQPVGVEWAGWRTDTVALQRSGWRLAVEFDPAYYRYRLLMQHTEMKLTAITDANVLEDVLGHYGNASHYPMFRVRHVAPSFQVRVIHDNWDKFREIDAEPQYIEEKIQRPEDLNIFARGRAEEVLVDKADMTVIEHLEAIKALQSAKQREIRDRLLRAKTDEPVRSGKSVIAQLVSYREAA